MRGPSRGVSGPHPQLGCHLRGHTAVQVDPVAPSRGGVSSVPLPLSLGLLPTSNVLSLCERLPCGPGLCPGQARATWGCLWSGCGWSSGLWMDSRALTSGPCSPEAKLVLTGSSRGGPVTSPAWKSGSPLAAGMVPPGQERPFLLFPGAAPPPHVPLCLLDPALLVCSPPGSAPKPSPFISFSLLTTLRQFFQKHLVRHF